MSALRGSRLWEFDSRRPATRLQMAAIIVRVKRRSWAMPDDSDKEVRRVAAMPLKDLKALYARKQPCHTAMLWNTLTAGGPVTVR